MFLVFLQVTHIRLSPEGGVWGRNDPTALSAMLSPEVFIMVTLTQAYAAYLVAKRIYSKAKVIRKAYKTHFGKRKRRKVNTTRYGNSMQ